MQSLPLDSQRDEPVDSNGSDDGFAGTACNESPAIFDSLTYSDREENDVQ